MDSPHLERALRIKTNSYRGGAVENVYFRNVTVGQVSDAVVQVDFYYEEGLGGQFLPTVRNIALQNVGCRTSKYALNLRGIRLRRFAMYDYPTASSNVSLNLT